MPERALLVTGASRGIGRACALLAARNGWSVGVNYREDAKAADAVVEKIAQGGGRALTAAVRRSDTSETWASILTSFAAADAFGAATGRASAGVAAAHCILRSGSARSPARVRGGFLGRQDVRLVGGAFDSPGAEPLPFYPREGFSLSIGVTKLASAAN